MNRDYRPGEIIKKKYKVIKQLYDNSDDEGNETKVYLCQNITLDSSKNKRLNEDKIVIKFCKRPWTNNNKLEYENAIGKHTFNDTVDWNGVKKDMSEEACANLNDWDKLRDEYVTNERLSNSNHPSFVKLYNDGEIDEENHVIMFVMEYVDGGSLEHMLDEKKHFSVKEGIYIFNKILDGIKYLHHQKDQIIHRDLKPENILISRDLSKVKIIDFGISTIIDRASNRILNSEYQLYGTYQYLSPDLTRLYSNTPKIEVIKPMVDFYPLGVIFYKMLIGKHPFYLKDEKDWEAQDGTGLKTPLKYDIPYMNKINPKISNGIENIIFRCMCCKPEDLKYRYTDVDQIIEDLNLVNNNYQKSFGWKLIKPLNKRVYAYLPEFTYHNKTIKSKNFLFHPITISAISFIVVCIIVFTIIYNFIK